MRSYNKLVRDKIPKILDKKGASYEKRIASDQEYKEELIKKLLEEAKEFSIEPITEELADVMEVVKALQGLSEYSDVESVRLKKKQERGGFEKKLILKGEYK